MKFFAISSIVLILSACTSGIQFDPNWYMSDYENEQIVNEAGHAVECADPNFNKFACMHEEKIKELKKILINARLPKEEKEKILTLLPATSELSQE